MKCDELLTATFEQKKAWLEQNIPDPYYKAGEHLLGFYHGPLYDGWYESEYKDYVEETGVIFHLREGMPDLAQERVKEIESGSDLTEEERENLEKIIVEHDEFGWSTYHGFEAKCDDGTVFVAFSGVFEGPFWPTIDFAEIYRSKEDALVFLRSQKHYTIE